MDDARLILYDQPTGKRRAALQKLLPHAPTESPSSPSLSLPTTKCRSYPKTLFVLVPCVSKIKLRAEWRQQLGLGDEILSDGSQNIEKDFWNPRPPAEPQPQELSAPDGCSLKTVHVRILGYTAYTKVAWGASLRTTVADPLNAELSDPRRLVGVRLDEACDFDVPVVADIDYDGHCRTVRTKYLVDADGALLTLRWAIGARMEGDTEEAVWGVVDFVADADFPDRRRLAHDKCHPHARIL